MNTRSKHAALNPAPVRKNYHVEVNNNIYKKNVEKENNTSVQCKHKVQNSDRLCKRKTKLYPKYCWTHANKEFGVKIATSSIPNAGKGIFATKDLPKNHMIQYARQKDFMTHAQMDARYPGDTLAPYGMCDVHSDKCWDGLPYRSGLGRWANDPRGTKKKDNLTFVVQDHKAYVKTTKKVKKGDELLIKYGRQYWNR